LHTLLRRPPPRLLLLRRLLLLLVGRRRVELGVVVVELAAAALLWCPSVQSMGLRSRPMHIHTCVCEGGGWGGTGRAAQDCGPTGARGRVQDLVPYQVT
jgi:hypothetical protein